MSYLMFGVLEVMNGSEQMVPLSIRARCACDQLACCSMNLGRKLHQCIPRGTSLSEEISFVALNLSALLFDL